MIFYGFEVQKKGFFNFLLMAKFYQKLIGCYSKRKRRKKFLIKGKEKRFVNFLQTALGTHFFFVVALFVLIY